jgi:hypothetical protein
VRSVDREERQMRNPSERKTGRIGVRLDQDELSKLERLRSGRQISDVIRSLIAKAKEIDETL